MSQDNLHVVVENLSSRRGGSVACYRSFRIVIQDHDSEPVVVGSMGVTYPRGNHPDSIRFDMSSVVWSDNFKELRPWIIGSLFEAIPKSSDVAAAMSTILVRVGVDNVTKLPDDPSQYGKIINMHHMDLPISKKRISIYFFGSHYDIERQKQIRSRKTASFVATSS